METLLQDFRYGIRMLMKRSGIIAVAALVLALGIGANSAIFSVVNAVLLRPLPYKEPNRLVVLWQADLQKGIQQGTFSVPKFADVKEQNHVFQDLGAYTNNRNFTFTGQ